MSPQQSKVNFETRTPTAWGEARTFLEFDFAGDPAASQRLHAISDNLRLRLRFAYATLGGFLAGQANSNFSDSDASTEAISFSGLVGDPGPSRLTQVRYTMPLAPYGFLGAFSVSAEVPETEIWTAGGGGVFGAWAAPPAGTIPTIGGVTINPLKTPAPDLTAAWYIPQPWGHVDFAAVVRPTLQFKDGFGANGIERNYVGWGVQLSGDVKPGWFGWNRDFITWHIGGGEAVGRYISAGSGNSTIGLVSNYGAPGVIPNTASAPGNILIKPVVAWGGNVGYRRQWLPNLRSNIGIGIYHEDINTLRGVVCGGPGGPGTAKATGAGGCGLNKELVNALVNVVWNPVPFADVALEYMWGHRLTVSNANADLNVILSRFRVQF